MNDSVIDFAQLRKLERLRMKKDRLAKKQQQKQKVTLDNKDDDRGRDNEEKNRMEGSTKTTASTIEASTVPQCCSNELLKESNANTSTGSSTLEVFQIKQSNLKHVYYIPQCLTDDYIQSLSNWLYSLPSVSYDSNDPSNGTSNHMNNNSNMDDYFNGKWTRLKHAQRNVALFDLRRLQNQPQKMTIDSKMHNTNHFNATNTILLDRLCQLLLQIKAFPESHPPNHVLINEYEPTEGIMPHTDGPLYYHRTATFSIGGDVLFQFTKREREPGRFQKQEKDKITIESNNAISSNNDDIVMQIMLSGKGSLIVFDGDAYINHCHSINDRILNNHKIVEYAGPKCVNLEQGATVERGHRFSLTFRHKH